MADDLVAFFAAREPVLDHPEVIGDAASFDREVAADYWEIGASGSVYGRDAVKSAVLGRLAGTHAVSLVGGYRIEGFATRLLGDDVAHVTYDLHAQGRVTRRSSFYRRADGAWQVVFHQGTVVDGAVPLPPDRAEPAHSKDLTHPEGELT